jgi:hypothetical protein
VISAEPFDEVDEFECVIGAKRRFFAAVRQGSHWILSCHVPGEVLTKEQKKQNVPSHGNAVRATSTFEQFAAHFLATGSGASALVVGGDFNTSVEILNQNLKGEGPVCSSGCCKLFDFKAPNEKTCLDVDWPIDGIFVATQEEASGDNSKSEG